MRKSKSAYFVILSILMIFCVGRSTNNAHQRCVRLVRGNDNYGMNNFVDNEDGTITDLSTGLMWQTADSGKGLNGKMP